MEVRIEKRTFEEWKTHYKRNRRGRASLWNTVKIYVILVNGRRVDSFLKRRNAEAKARKLRAPSL